MKPLQAARVAVVGAGLLLLAGSAAAQPAMHHRGPADVAMAIAAAKGQLNLNTSQQQMWDNAVAASRNARAAARANFASLQAAATAELAKAEPDLAALAAMGDDTQARNVASRRQARDAWLALYATFTPDQKAVVRDVLRQKMARMEQMREKFQGRHGRG
jgi:hypothetical protein